MRFYVLLTRKADRARFLYGFANADAAIAFQRRNRAPMPDGIPSPYGVSEILFRCSRAVAYRDGDVKVVTA
jgi:hypothetical protein